MIGQKALISRIDKLIEQQIFPQFAIIVGQRGSGKKTLCSEIFQKLNVFACFEPDNKVETVRNVIIDAYKVGSPTCYVFADVDDMSVQAKNALLKIVEEPPNNAYFIMTVSDINNVLDTIRSRASIYYMQPYSKSELKEYATKYTDFDLYADICTTPGEIDKLHDMGANEFYDYVGKVIDNVAYVSLANAFKIVNKLALKSDTEGYDIKLFLMTFEKICKDKMLESIEDKEECKYWIDAVKIVSKILTQLQVTGINKGALFDRFILEIRKAWN